MRMWMVNPALLCRRHLLGEHNELHMLAGTLLRSKSVEGFVRQGLLQPASLHQRHALLVREMLARGYRHQSPLPEAAALRRALAVYAVHVRRATVDQAASLQELQRRCPHCALRITTQAHSGDADAP